MPSSRRRARYRADTSHSEHAAVGPKGLPLLGHLHHFARNPLPFLTRCVAEYGPVVALQLGKPTLLITDPEDIKHVLIHRSQEYAKTPRLSGDDESRVHGGGLLTRSSGPAHLRRRRTLQPVFLRRAITAYEAKILDCVQSALCHWQPGTVVDIAADVKALTLRTLVRLLFGDLGGRESEVLRAMGVRRKYYEHLVSSLFPWPRYFPAIKARGHRKARALIDRTVAEAIETRRPETPTPDNLVSMLIQARGKDEGGLDDQQVRGEIFTFLDAGYETVAANIAWSIMLLASNQDWQGKLREEVQSVAGDEPPRASQIERLPILRAVLSESMRLFPPTWMFVRVARTADHLPSGASVAAGTKLYLCQYLAHRNPDQFPDPEAFQPERFLQSIPPAMSYFPFGRGAHKCIGEPLAELEASLILASIVQRWKIHTTTRHVSVDAHMVLRPKNGILVRLERVDPTPQRQTLRHPPT